MEQQVMDDETRDYMCEALVRRGRQIAAQMKSDAEEIKKILARLDELTPPGWELNVDGIPARKKPGNRSFSPEMAMARFSTEEIESCKAEGLDMKKVRELAEAKGLIEACMAPPKDDKQSVVLK